jgi:hypothetical protein
MSGGRYRGDNRGRHRKRSSPETRRWARLFPLPAVAKEEKPPQPTPTPKPELPPPPPRPSWIPPNVYEELLRLRRGLA